jgi:probable HAF family extracellular repeat protein
MNFSKFTLLSLVALLLATSTTVLSQSPSATRPGKKQVSPSQLLGLGSRPGAAQARTGPVPDAVALGLAKAKVYHFASADFPGAATSLVFDRNVSTVLGDTSLSNASAFTLRGGTYQLFSVPGSTGNEATGINTGGSVIGIYVDLNGATHGFVDNAGVFTNLDLAGGQIEPIGINDGGEIVGTFIDSSSVFHGFTTVDNGTSYSLFDVPGSTSTEAAGINSAGTIVGLYTDASSINHGFLFANGTFTSIDFPLATSTTAIGINDSNEIAGFYTDAGGVNHGFIYSAGAFRSVDVAGASATQLTRIKNNGQITGLYSDSASETHGVTGR